MLGLIAPCRNFGGGGSGGAADKMVEQGHADGEAVGDLFEDAGLRAVGDGVDQFPGRESSVRDAAPAHRDARVAGAAA